MQHASANCLLDILNQQILMFVGLRGLCARASGKRQLYIFCLLIKLRFTISMFSTMFYDICVCQQCLKLEFLYLASEDAARCGSVDITA